MRAFVITLDALVAVAFLFIVTIVLYTQTFSPNTMQSIYLKHYSLDFITVMEKTGKLDLTIANNSTAMHQILEQTSERICMQVTITNSDEIDLATISKTNCGEYGTEIQVAAVPHAYDNEIYMITAKSWYKKT
ncbi:hypothetical protein KKF81_05025 [Candidatus Micrarchaeota archaeon]|nr:hypothetical protein [Candidatus Micrarchaeota archaeon]MBU1166289.1 hypothetical protein [Candidatus Micrarchaeota archaeon]MBU1886264.1 hypothetical protein [Candidatus Micrarchaeota archaeon]